MIEIITLKNIKTVLALCTVILFLLDRLNQFVMFLEVKDYNLFYTTVPLIANEV